MTLSKDEAKLFIIDIQSGMSAVGYDYDYIEQITKTAENEAMVWYLFDLDREP